jgi:hypothetical protein
MPEEKKPTPRNGIDLLREAYRELDVTDDRAARLSVDIAVYLDQASPGWRRR